MIRAGAVLDVAGWIMTVLVVLIIGGWVWGVLQF